MGIFDKQKGSVPLPARAEKAPARKSVSPEVRRRGLSVDAMMSMGVKASFLLPWLSLMGV